MKEYIDKDAVVAEINKEIKDIYAGREYVGIPSWQEREIDGLEKAIEIINTLEVKEVDLEKEIEDYIYTLPHSKTGIPNGWKHSWPKENVIKIAEHFYELGLKAQKGE